MLTALIRRRARLLLGRVLLAVLLVLAVVAFGGGADVVVYNGRSQYGDETVFKALEEANGQEARAARRHRARAVRAAAQRGLRDARRTCSSRPTSRTSGARRRPACSRRSSTPKLEQQVPAECRDPGRRLVGAEPARPHADALDRACPRTR